MPASHRSHPLPSYQAIISTDQYHDGGGPTGQTQRRRRQARIHPVLYVFSVISAVILLSLAVAALSGYAPPSAPHLPSKHDELLQWPGDQRVQTDSDSNAHMIAHDGKQGKRERYARRSTSHDIVNASWNSIASAFGGFSSAYITSPQLNASWIARPAGFGPRVVGEIGLEGILAYMQTKSKDDSKIGRQLSTSDRTGCASGLRAFEEPTVNLDDGGKPHIRLPRVALIERGGCPFVTMILNAQAQDFDAAIVYNDYAHSVRPRNGLEGDVMHDYTDEDELISMWSPLREAAYVHIPSVFVSYSTGNMLQGLLAVEHDDKQEAIIILEPESPPHLLLMDVIIVLFFLPMVFTTVVLIFTRLRQIRHRAQQRAPVSLVESLPTFKWREGLDLNLDALSTGEKDTNTPHSDTSTKSAGMDSRLVQLVTRALRRPAPPGDGISARHAVIPVKKARHIAKKIFQQKECAICLADFIHDDDVRLLPCGHLFHKTEIDLWLTEQKRWCPICRYSIDGSDEEERVEGHSATSPVNPSPSNTEPAIGATLATAAQPILRRGELDALSEEEEEPPVPGSSTAHERTPLLPTL